MAETWIVNRFLVLFITNFKDVSKEEKSPFPLIHKFYMPVFIVTFLVFTGQVLFLLDFTRHAEEMSKGV